MKITKRPILLMVLQIIYVLSCVLSISCFAINRFWGIHRFFSLGIPLVYGWLVNPVGIMALVIGITTRITSDDRRGWLRYILCFVLDIVLFVVAGCLMVEFTGGV